MLHLGLVLVSSHDFELVHCVTACLLELGIYVDVALTVVYFETVLSHRLVTCIASLGDPSHDLCDELAQSYVIVVVV